MGFTALNAVRAMESNELSTKFWFDCLADNELAMSIKLSKRLYKEKSRNNHGNGKRRAPLPL